MRGAQLGVGVEALGDIAELDAGTGRAPVAGEVDRLGSVDGAGRVADHGRARGDALTAPIDVVAAATAASRATNRWRYTVDAPHLSVRDGVVLVAATPPSPASAASLGTRLDRRDHDRPLGRVDVGQRRKDAGSENGTDTTTLQSSSPSSRSADSAAALDAWLVEASVEERLRQARRQPVDRLLSSRCRAITRRRSDRFEAGLDARVGRRRGRPRSCRSLVEHTCESGWPAVRDRAVRPQHRAGRDRVVAGIDLHLVPVGVGRGGRVAGEHPVVARTALPPRPRRRRTSRRANPSRRWPRPPTAAAVDRCGNRRTVVPRARSCASNASAWGSSPTSSRRWSVAGRRCLQDLERIWPLAHSPASSAIRRRNR